MTENKLEALIFDVDGTLADTECDGHRVAFNLAFEDSGVEWNWSIELYGELLSVTGGKERIRYYIEQYLNNEISLFTDQNDISNFIIALHQLKTRFYTELLSQGKIPLRLGVRRLLYEARAAGLRLAIATTTTPENVSALLTQTLGSESLDWFEVIAAGDIVDQKKPAGDIYHYVLQQMKLPAANCLAFEDSENGLRSALAERLTTIVTINAYTKSHDFNGAALVLDHLGEPDVRCNRIVGNSFSSEYLDVDGCRVQLDLK